MPEAPNNPTNERIRVSALVLIPIAFFAMLAVAFVMLVFNVGNVGQAQGARVSVTWSFDCPSSQVTPVLNARGQAMGLSLVHDTSKASSLITQMTLPESETDHHRIPQALARPGVLTIRDSNGETLAANVNLSSTGVEIDLAGMPTTMLRFDAVAIPALSTALKAGAKPLEVLIDGTTVATFLDLPDLDEGYLEIPSGQGATRERMLIAADRSIVLGDGPLPCKVDVAGVVPVGTAG